MLLEYILGALFVMLLFFLIRRFPRRWWLWLWFPTMAGVLFGVYLSPLLVDPLYNTFVPLSHARPALVEQLERVAEAWRPGYPARSHVPHGGVEENHADERVRNRLRQLQTAGHLRHSARQGSAG